MSDTLLLSEKVNNRLYRALIGWSILLGSTVCPSHLFSPQQTMTIFNYNGPDDIELIHLLDGKDQDVCMVGS